MLNNSVEYKTGPIHQVQNTLKIFEASHFLTQSKLCRKKYFNRLYRVFSLCNVVCDQYIWRKRCQISRHWENATDHLGKRPYISTFLSQPKRLKAPLFQKETCVLGFCLFQITIAVMGLSLPLGLWVLFGTTLGKGLKSAKRLLKVDQQHTIAVTYPSGDAQINLTRELIRRFTFVLF